MDKKPINYSEDTRELMNGIYRVLKNNARYYKSAELQETFDVSGPKIREAIHGIREARYPIISNRHGYKWAESAKELNQCVDALWGRAKSMHRAIQGLAESRKKFFPAHLGGIDPNTVEATINQIDKESHAGNN